MLKIAGLLGIPKAHAVGLMECLWHWAAKFCPQGDIGKWGDESIADGAGWPSTDAGIFTAALLQAGWLDESAEFRLIIHDWPEHCEDSIHVALAKAVKFFADGTQPRLTRVSAKEREQISAAFEAQREIARNRAKSRSIERSAEREIAPALPCLALPKPKPNTSFESFTETDETPAVLGQIVKTHKTAGYKHAVKIGLIEREWANAISKRPDAPLALAHRIRDAHTIACKTNTWQGGFIEALDKWLQREGWRDEFPEANESPPTTLSEEEYKARARKLAGFA